MIAWYKDIPARNADGNGFRVDEFAMHVGIPSRIYDEWVHMHDCVNEANEEAKKWIAIRRENGMCTSKLHHQATAFMMGQYCKGWDNEQRRRELARTQNPDDTRQIIVEIPNFVLTDDPGTQLKHDESVLIKDTVDIKNKDDIIEE